MRQRRSAVQCSVALVSVQPGYVEGRAVVRAGPTVRTCPAPARLSAARIALTASVSPHPWPVDPSQAVSWRLALLTRNLV